MITIYKDENNRLKYDDTYTQLELRGLSDDNKPTQIDGRLLANGSSFVEIDTGDMYLYDLSNNAWNKIETGGGGGGGSTTIEEKDVNLWDYDGSLVKSYSRNDFLALTSLPSNPSHEGLTAQGWNWELAEAKTYVATYGGLDIGQTYVTDDNSTRIYIELLEGALKPYLGFAINGTATIDWGDGNTETVTHNSTSTVYSNQHTYASAGKYVIKITSDTQIYLIGTSYNTKFIWNNESGSTKERNYIYSGAVYKIEIGNNVVLGDYALAEMKNLQIVNIHSYSNAIGQYAFKGCTSLKQINLPKNTTIGQYCFNMCYLIKHICFPNTIATIPTLSCSSINRLERIYIPSSVTTINSQAFSSSLCNNIILPNSITSIGDNAFSSNSNMREIILGENITTLGTDIFRYNYGLTKVVMPKNVTELKANTFYSCYSLCIVDFSKAESIPTLANTSNVFYNNNSALKIIVPDSLYETWKTTANWSSYSSKIVKASEV